MATSTYCFVQDDHEVLDQLMDLVSYPPDPAMEALSAQGCTGGRRVCL